MGSLLCAGTPGVEHIEPHGQQGAGRDLDHGIGRGDRMPTGTAGCLLGGCLFEHAAAKDAPALAHGLLTFAGR